jgi:hypothetical protein
MSASEGVRRLSRAIRLVGIFFGVAIGWMGYRNDNRPLILIGVLILAGALLVAWIVAGFGQPSPPKDEPPKG